MISKIFIFLLFVCGISQLAGANETEPVGYDQRQTGHYNIHISIKDVAIIDLEGNDFTDKKPGLEDYYYDDSDFTIKPISAWLTSKPTSTAIAPPSTTLAPVTPPAVVSESETNMSTININSSVTIPVTTPILGTSATPTIDISSALNTTHLSEEIPKPMSSTTKKPNVVILGTNISTSQPETPIQYPASFGTLIPVQVISDPLLRQRHRSGGLPISRLAQRLKNNISERSASGAHPNDGANFDCPRGQLMDARGNCRSRRSSIM